MLDQRLLRRPLRSLAVALALLATGSLAQAFDPTSATAQYRLTFEASWSQATHPQAFPSNPHFSGLIGGTHSAAASFWEPGQLASFGIELMAETGSKSALRNEVNAAIGAGVAGQVIEGPVMALSPGTVNATFTVTQDYPLASVVAMIAPSPDWFIGVHGLSLRQDGQWIQELIVDLQPYDSGTDSGVSYTSANFDTNPAVPIFEIQNAPLSPDGGPAVPLGTFRFVRLDGDGTPGVGFCFGDSGCPCGNDDGSGSAGCVNSSGGGASLTGSGSTSVSADDLVLTATGFPAGNTGIAFMGAGTSAPINVGDGLVCTGGLFRFAPGIVDGSGTLTLQTPVAAAPAGQITAGRTRHFQMWTRDVLCGPPPAPCPSPCGNNSSVSNGYSVVFTP